MPDSIENINIPATEKFGALVPVAKPQSDKDWQDTFVACLEKLDSKDENEAIDALRKARYISGQIGVKLGTIFKNDELKEINKRLGAQNVQLRREMAEMSRIVDRYSWRKKFARAAKSLVRAPKELLPEIAVASSYAGLYFGTNVAPPDVLFLGGMVAAIGLGFSCTFGRRKVIHGIACAAVVIGIIAGWNMQFAELDQLRNAQNLVEDMKAKKDLGPDTRVAKYVLRDKVHMVTVEGQNFSIAVHVPDPQSPGSDVAKEITCIKYWQAETDAPLKDAGKIILTPDRSKPPVASVGNCAVYDALHHN